MIEIYSKVEDNRLLHKIISVSEVRDRVDLSNVIEPLQVAIHLRNIGNDPQPHIHIKKAIAEKEVSTQESWFIFSGEVDASFYDIDESLLMQIRLKPGHLAVTYQGGHSFKVEQDNTIIVEHKNGPYDDKSRGKKILS